MPNPAPAAAQYALRVKWVPAPAFGMAERFMTEGRVVLRYLELFFLPLPSQMTLDYAWPLSTSLLTPPSTLLAFAIHAALIAGAVRFRRRRPLLTLGILGFYLLQLPEGTFMPLDLIFEHRAYFPAFFLALALMDLLLWGIGRLGAHHPARGALAVAVALAALLGGFGYQRNQLWADPVKLWEDTVAKAPGNARALTNLGEAYVVSGNPGKAVGYLEEAIRLKPDDVLALANLGAAHGALGNPGKSVGYLQEAIRLRPDDVLALTNLGAAYVRLGNPGKAVGYFQEAIRLKPDYPEALTNLGGACLDLGNAQQAVGYFQEALRLKPDYLEALVNLSATYHKLGLLEKSEEYSRRAIAVRPNSAAGYYNLGITLLKMGRVAEATAVGRSLQDIDPALAQRLRGQMPGPGE